MVSNKAIYLRTGIFILGIVLCSQLSAQVRVKLPWYHSLPNTDEGKQKKEQIELYKSKGDIRNMKLVSKFARRIEPGCFYFAQSFVEASYNSREGAEVLKLSDSLSWSDLATPETYQYNAWIHDWNKDKKGAYHAVNKGLKIYQDDRLLLRTGMHLATDAGDLTLANRYGIVLLNKYPRDWQTYYDYHKMYIDKSGYDYAIIMGELALSVGPNNPKNVEIKNNLITTYNKWLKARGGSRAFASLSKMPSGLTQVRNMQDLLLLQGFMTYNYGLITKGNKLEELLYEYKFKIIESCNWVAYYYELFGVSLFPRDYDQYLTENMQELSALNLCLSKIEAIH